MAEYSKYKREYRRAIGESPSRDLMPCPITAICVWIEGLGLRPADLLRYITLEIQEDRIRDFRFSVHRSSGLRALRQIRGLRNLHIKIHSSCNRDYYCLGCGREKSVCKGNFKNFLTREKPMLRKTKPRFLGITSALPLIAKADLRLLVTYQHDTQSIPRSLCTKQGRP